MVFALNHIATPNLPLDAFFELAKSLGMTQVEIRNDLPDTLGSMPAETVRAAAEIAGVEILAINALYPFNDWSGDLPERAVQMADYAAASGATGLVMCPRNDGKEISRDALISSLVHLAPILRERGLTGFVEPLGFPSASLHRKSDAVEAIKAANATDCFKLVHDTFHHHLAGETEVFPEMTGLVHISGVVDPEIAITDMLDDHRVLVDPADRLENVLQIAALRAGGYEGPFSFEPFAPEVHALTDPKAALEASMKHVTETTKQALWSQNREGDWPVMRVFAYDHRMQFEEMEGASPEKIGRFKQLCVEATLAVSDGRPGYGLLCDGRLGVNALADAAGKGLWIGHPVEWPGSRPLRLEPELRDDFSGLREWPSDHVIKCLCFCHPDDDAEMWADQISTIRQLFTAGREAGLEFLLEVIPSKVAPVTDETTATIIHRIYAEGIFPDWWKLEPFKTHAAWKAACDAIEAHDPNTRGIVVLGLDAPRDELAASFELAATFPLVKGFAIGRTIFGDSARAWLKGEISDEEAVAEMARRYRDLCSVWDAATVRTGDMS